MTRRPDPPSETSLELPLGLPMHPPDQVLRQRWRQLVEHRLPAAAVSRGWPIQNDHCFARVLLDNAVGAPWRLCIRPPAWRNAPPETLENAIALGEAALAGRRDMAALDERSQALRRAAR